MLKPTAVIAIVCALLAGCGSAKKQSSVDAGYDAHMANVIPGVQGALLKGRLALEQVQSQHAAKGQLLQIEAKLRRAVTTLSAVKPPPAVAADQAQLVAAYRTLLAHFHSLDALTRQATTNALRVRAGKLDADPALRAVATALRAMIARGYDLGLPSGQ